MKKITLLFTLLIFSIGYSQQLPLTFDDPADDEWLGFGGSSASVIDDSGDQVLQVTGSGAEYDGVYLDLALAVDLSDNTNNTITLDVNPTNVGSGEVRTHLLKFENGTGGPAVSEVTFTTTGTGWQTVNVDFPSGLGIFPRIVIFTDFGPGNTATGIYLFDEITGAQNVAASCDDGVLNGDEVGIDCGGASCPSCPDLPPPAAQPTTPDAEVYSINSDTGGYTTGFDYEGGCFGVLDEDIDLDLTAGSNKALRFDFSVAGWGCTNSAPVNVSTIGGNPIAFVSFQYYTEDATDFYLDLISGPGGSTTESFYYIGQSSAGGAPAADEPLVQGSWQHVIIPISEFTSQTFNTSEFFQFKFDVFAGATPGIVYIDNLLFSSSSPTLGTNNLSITDFKYFPNPTQNEWNIKTGNGQIESITLMNILGKQVMNLKINSNSASIPSANLSKGIYFAKVKTENGNAVLKLIKN